jgi:flavin reductase (DIM6/NTAB) family NADH-FMN oxidoreductase RutF
MQTGIPLISGGMAFMEAKVVHQYAMPTSTLFIVQVISMAKNEDSEPLVYFDRDYHRLEYEP